MLTEEQALKILNNDGVVAIPTETVYGLAARIDSESALTQIFKVKERPFFDPLIVHVSSADQAREYSKDWTAVHECLAEAFWPGPLTIVTPKKDNINNLITSGLPTVGLRCPNHRVAINLIKKLGVPLAAPSANKFSKTSPTSLAHVKESLPEVAVLDGGSCEVGIESTIISISNNTELEVQLLRPGMISLNAIRAALDKVEVKFVEEKNIQVMPGSLDDHYMPILPLVTLDQDLSEDQIIRNVQSQLSIQGKNKLNTFTKLKLPKEPYLAARQLYLKLREVTSKDCDFIVFKIENYMRAEGWSAILDRLSKASSLHLK